MITPQDASNYLGLHLKNLLWQQAGAALQGAALNMAINDLKNYLHLDSLDETDANMLCAVYEQAIFLLERHLKNLDENLPVTQQRIDGVGTTSYQIASRNELMIARRAQAFLNRLSPINHISRG